jgi:hypothetical protein
MLLLRVNIVSGTADDGNKFLLLWPQVSPYGDGSLLQAQSEIFCIVVFSYQKKSFFDENA